MTQAHPLSDPWRWHIALALVFAALVACHLGLPSKMYFDEIHYVPAARQMLAGHAANPEHPLLGKIAIAGAIRALGDTPFAWRLPSALMGVVGLFAFGRMLWWMGHWGGRRRGVVASLAGMVLLGSDFAWFIQSRIAMLDMVMAGFGMVALWMLAAAVPEWRWVDGREDSPWYPVTRIFRQSTLEDWSPVIERVRVELQMLVAARQPAVCGGR